MRNCQCKHALSWHVHLWAHTKSGEINRKCINFIDNLTFFSSLIGAHGYDRIVGLDDYDKFGYDKLESTEDYDGDHCDPAPGTKSAVVDANML